MALRIYNTLIKKKEDFLPVNPPEVRMYVCGITPYDETHVGHARAYVTFDVIYRYLEESGYRVTYVQNITDVDDKIIKKSHESRVTSRELTDKYTNSYFEVMEQLNVKRASRYPKATEHIKDMIKWIEGLVEKGYAYVVEGDVYYEVEKFKDYGKLSQRKKKDLLAGARVAVDERKKNPLDFALWKAAKEGEPSWDSPWGPGRPGWHIECSVMSTKYLGEQFDIHGGGRDLIFPHHENEIAQTEALTGKIPWVKYWVHNGFVNVNQQKMSKSLGNFFTLRDVFKKFDPMVVRFFLLQTHYRSSIDFSDEQLKEAKEAFRRLEQTIQDVNFYLEKITVKEGEINLSLYKNRFTDAMDDDFNTAKALAVVFDLVTLAHEKIGSKSMAELEQIKKLILKFTKVLGLELRVKVIPHRNILELVKKREKAKADKDFETADKIRDGILALGYELKDTPQGTILSGPISKHHI